MEVEEEMWGCGGVELAMAGEIAQALGLAAVGVPRRFDRPASLGWRGTHGSIALAMRLISCYVTSPCTSRAPGLAQTSAPGLRDDGRIATPNARNGRITTPMKGYCCSAALDDGLLQLATSYVQSRYSRARGYFLEQPCEPDHGVARQRHRMVV